MTDMDAILDEALDELDDDEREESKNEEVLSPPISSKEPCTESNNEYESVNIKESTKLDENKSSSEAFQTMLRDFVEAESNEDDVDEQIETFMNQIDGVPPPPTSSSQEGNVEKDLANLLEEMAKASIGESANGHEDDFLREMLGLQDGGSDDFNSDTVIDGMMEQLLSKDLMYEPMKQVTEKFPEWLETNKADLSQKDYQERCKQYECFTNLVDVYEKNPENTSKLLELMQQVQEFGQPPQEIIRDIAPGLELDDDGMPKINPMMGLGGGDEECIIM